MHDRTDGSWHYGKVNWVFAIGIARLVAWYVGRLAIMSTPAWLATARWLTSFV